MVVMLTSKRVSLPAPLWQRSDALIQDYARAACSPPFEWMIVQTPGLKRG
jgi:hypothetical protein